MLAGGAARVRAEGQAHISPGRQPWVYGWFLSLQANGLPHSVAPSISSDDVRSGIGGIDSESRFVRRDESRFEEISDCFKDRLV